MLLLKSLIKQDSFVALAITLLFLLAVETGWFAALDRQAYNLGVQFSSSKEAHEDVVVVAIDDESIQALGAWPWPRAVLAELTLLLGRAGPQVIGYNLPLDNPQNQDGIASLTELRKVLNREKKLSSNVNRALRVAETTQRGDDRLAASFKAGGRIVLGMPYTVSNEPLGGLSPALPAQLQRFVLEKVSVNNAPRGFGWPTPGVTRAGKVFPPIAKFTRQVGSVGVIGSDDIFNGEPLVVQYGSDVLPSFALMMVTRGKGLSMEHIESRSEISPELGGKSLGADVELRIYPRYYQGKDGKSPFAIFSLIDVLAGNVDMGRFRDKVIIVGPTSTRLTPTMLTPTGDSISSTVATAHTVSSLLNNEQYRLPEWAIWAQRGLILSVGLYLMLVISRFRTNTAFFLSLFLVLMIFNAHFLLMSTQSLWLPMMAAVVMLLLGHLVLGTRQWMKVHLQGARDEVLAANRQVAMALQAQGYLDQAFEKFRHCRVDDSLLGQVYNLGLDYERKRQFNKAGAVYKFILQHNPEYNDVSERIEQNKQAANTVVLTGHDTGGPGPSLISSQDGVQKPKLGRYQIDREIGRGAMGMVYLGHDDKIGRTVAIKTMLLSADIEDGLRDEVRTRFFREAEAAGRLNHPNIVTVYDVGDEQDLAYIAMDYLKGKDLTAYITAKTRLPVSVVFSIISSIAMALDYAHQQHVVHRDIKPANIIYDREKNIAKVTDFGVACLTDASKTKTGTVLGSPYYMSPEQLAGKKVDGRADLFSLGVTLYQMLSGALPFNGDSIANLMYNIANEAHPDIRRFRGDLPNCVQKLVNKALQKDVAKRFQTGKEMALAMKRCQEHIREMEAA
jgi:eukaryotic-like serine/threonine-protein kinase